MNQITHYELVSGKTAESLTQAVTLKIASGFQPLGAAFIKCQAAEGPFFQTVVKYAP